MEPKLVDISGSALSLLKRDHGFKPHSHMESPLWLVLYLLWADSVRARIRLDCGTNLKVSDWIVLFVFNLK